MATQTQNLRNIFTLFETAISNRLKYPRIRLQTAGGSPVVLKLAGSKSRYTGQIMVTNGGTFGTNDNIYFGRITEAGELLSTGGQTTAEIRSLLARLAENPAETVAQYGRVTGNCSFCELRLTDARSTSVGYGPICAEHYNLPWGSDFKSFPNTQQLELEPTPTSFESESASFISATPTPEELLLDPCTPFWAADVIRVALKKDPCDVCGVFEVLAKSFNARVELIQKSAR
jgi:Family of unknown function (DUF6011)